MTKVLKIFMIVSVLFVSASQYAHNNEKTATDRDSLANKTIAVEKKDLNNDSNHASHWGAVMNAIIQVESGGNSRAVNGKYVGAMQIGPIVVKDCNNILKKRGEAKRYTLADRYSVAKSKEMFLLIQSRYNPSNDIEKGIRIWNGGCNYKKASTNGYYRRVMSKLQAA